MRRILSLLAVLTVFLFAGSAHADTFSFYFHTGDYLYSGQLSLTGTAISTGVYYITSATGNVNGSAVSLITPPSGNPGDTFLDVPSNSTYNNLYYSTGYGPLSDSFDDIGGLLIEANGILYNIFYPYTFVPISTTGEIGNAHNIVYTDSPVTPPVPEPSSLLLIGTGSLGIAGAMRRRMRAA